MSERQSSKGTGEQLHDQRRKRFWTLIAALALIGFVIGFVASFAHIVSEGGNPPPAWLSIIAVAAAAALALYGSWRYFVSVDEVELIDNLWGSLIGFYAYATLFPAWWILNKLQAAPPPDDWAIFAASLIIAMIAYFYRKIAAR